MNFYWFSIHNEIVDKLQELSDHHFHGVLFAYGLHSGDFFTKIAKYANLNYNLKYMVAIRPYSISPQYLYMINRSLNEIVPNQLEINLVSGWSYETEKVFGGVLGSVNDLSSNIEKNNYLIEYLKVLNNMNADSLNFYVSVTNEHVYNIANKYNNKIIVPYSVYIQNKFSINNHNTTIYINPIIRKTQKELDLLNKKQKNQDMFFFTHVEFENLLNLLKEKNIKNILLRSENIEEKEFLIKFIKKYKEKDFDDNF
jgi:hypothetical protein